MTKSVAVHFVRIEGTEAGLGRIGSRTVIADRPQGMSGGQGLGFHGAELLASALGGGFWNELHIVAHAARTPITVDAVKVTMGLAGNPPRVVRAHVAVRLGGADPDQLRTIFDDTTEISTVANTMRAAFPIHFEQLTEVP